MIDMPMRLYHRSPVENRESILKNGLIAQIGPCYKEYWTRNNYTEKYNYQPAVFLYLVPGRAFGRVKTDIWEVNMSYIDFSLIKRDPAADGLSYKWFMYYGNIPPEALTRKGIRN